VGSDKTAVPKSAKASNLLYPPSNIGIASHNVNANPDDSLSNLLAPLVQRTSLVKSRLL